MGVIYYRNMINRQAKDDWKLINDVKRYPAIYDRYHPSYNDRLERKRIWQLIAQNLETTAQICEERWNRLIEMYKSAVLILPITLYEMMTQLLNVHCESTDLSAGDLEERINFEEVAAFELTDETCAVLPSDIKSFADDRPEVYSEYSDNFFETENVEFYS